MIAFAFLMTSCKSSSEISRSAETTGWTPRLLKPRMWPPVTPRYTLLISAPDMLSAPTMAFRTSSSACFGSTISPLRTPRERAWPTPMIFSEPSAACSPTTAQTFDVPISRPTMMFESSNIFPPRWCKCRVLGRNDRRGVRIHPVHRHIVGYRQVRRGDGLVVAQSQIVNDAPTPQLLLHILQAEGDFAAPPRRRNDDARFGNVNLAQIRQAGHWRAAKRGD